MPTTGAAAAALHPRVHPVGATRNAPDTAPQAAKPYKQPSSIRGMSRRASELWSKFGVLPSSSDEEATVVVVRGKWPRPRSGYHTATDDEAWWRAREAPPSALESNSDTGGGPSVAVKFTSNAAKRKLQLNCEGSGSVVLPQRQDHSPGGPTLKLSHSMDVSGRSSSWSAEAKVGAGHLDDGAAAERRASFMLPYTASTVALRSAAVSLKQTLQLPREVRADVDDVDEPVGKASTGRPDRTPTHSSAAGASHSMKIGHEAALRTCWRFDDTRARLDVSATTSSQSGQCWKAPKLSTALIATPLPAILSGLHVGFALSRSMSSWPEWLQSRQVSDLKSASTGTSPTKTRAAKQTGQRGSWSRMTSLLQSAKAEWGVSHATKNTGVAVTWSKGGEKWAATGHWAVTNSLVLGAQAASPVPLWPFHHGKKDGERPWWTVGMSSKVSPAVLRVRATRNYADLLVDTPLGPFAVTACMRLVQRDKELGGLRLSGLAGFSVNLTPPGSTKPPKGLADKAAKEDERRREKVMDAAFQAAMRGQR